MAILLDMAVPFSGPIYGLLLGPILGMALGPLWPIFGYFAIFIWA